MPSEFFGLPSLRIRAGGVVETYGQITVEAELDHVPRCKYENCRSAAVEATFADEPIRVWDTPSRGKPVEIVIHRRRFHCSTCQRTFSGRGPDVHPKHKVTLRLVGFIENRGLRKPIADVASETGVSQVVARRIIMALAKRLDANHKFELPTIVAVDDFQFKKRLNQTFTMMTSGEDGRPLEIVRGKRAAPLKAKLRHMPSRSNVRIFVSDLAFQNISLAREFPNALHVADKWHVQRLLQKPLSSLISAEIVRLRKVRGRRQDSVDLKAEKETLEGKRRRKIPEAEQLALDLKQVTPILTRVPRVFWAYHARRQMFRLYRSKSRADAEIQFNILLAIMSHRYLTTKFAKSISSLRQHRDIILNYFDTLSLGSKGNLVGVTTNRAERTNGEIKRIWKAARSIKNFDYLRLRVLYHRYQLGLDLVECHGSERCPIEGPFDPAEVLRRSRFAVSLRQHTRCSRCAAEPQLGV